MWILQIFKNTCLEEHLRKAASVKLDTAGKLIEMASFSFVLNMLSIYNLVLFSYYFFAGGNL